VAVTAAWTALGRDHLGGCASCVYGIGHRDGHGCSVDGAGPRVSGWTMFGVGEQPSLLKKFSFHRGIQDEVAG
jgi:hypothetical protein